MKIIKYLLILLAIILVAGLSFSGFIQIRGVPTYEIEQLDYTVESTPDKLIRGEKLVSMLCKNCHYNQETNAFTGKHLSDIPTEFGKIYSQNITQDETYGIGNYTDGELLYLLRTGIKKNGQYTPPYMSKLPHMSDEDIESIIAFIRSDDPMVAAASIPSQPCEPSFLVKFLCFVAFKPLKFPESSISPPDSSNKVELGKYLVYNLECYACHSADFKTLNQMQPELSEGFLGGGNKPLDLEGNVLLTQNLTPDKETGIGNWTEQQFVRAVKYGLKEGEHALRYPMMPYVQLTDHEAQSIFSYLQTVPPIKNDVMRSGL